MAGRSRATSPIPNCGPSAITARPGSIICASATAPRNPNARCISARSISIIGPDPIRVRRMLERPFGSVRWKEDTPDRRRQRGAAGRDRRGQQYVDLTSSFRDARLGAGPESILAIVGYGFRVRASRRPGMTRSDYCPWLASICWQALLMPGAVLLQARQYDLVAVVHLGPAKPRDVARAGVLSLLPLAAPG